MGFWPSCFCLLFFFFFLLSLIFHWRSGCITTWFVHDPILFKNYMSASFRNFLHINLKINLHGGLRRTNYNFGLELSQVVLIVRLSTSAFESNPFLIGFSSCECKISWLGSISFNKVQIEVAFVGPIWLHTHYGSYYKRIGNWRCIIRI